MTMQVGFSATPPPFNLEDEALTPLTTALARLDALRNAKFDEAGGDGDRDLGGDPPGRPVLDAPQEQYSPADLAILMRTLLSKVNDAQSKTAMEDVNLSELQRKEAYNESKRQIEIVIKKLAEAAQKEKALGALGVLGKVFAVIGAACLVALTGGAAAPFAVALLIYTTVDLVATLADKISTAAGGPRMSIDHWMAEGFAKAAELAGNDPDKAREIGQWTAFAIQAAVALATIVCGFGAAGRAVAAGADLTTKIVTQAINTTAKLVQAGSQVANGANQVVMASVSIARAVDENDAAQAKSEQMKFDAAAMLFADLVSQAIEQLKTLAEKGAEEQKNATDILRKGHDTNMAIIGNTGAV